MKKRLLGLVFLTMLSNPSVGLDIEHDDPGIEGQIDHMDQETNQIVIDDQTYHVAEVLKLDGDQRLDDQVLMALEVGERVLFWTEIHERGATPIITRIKTDIETNR